MYPDTTASITDTMRTLAYIGDLSMGQPTEHSLRTAWLAARIAAALGRGQEHCVTVQQVAMLRWSSCTANAADFDEIAGDDIASRADMLSHDKDPAFAQAAERIHKDVQRLTGIHCEVSAEIATLLRVPVEVQRALQGIFATYDGSGPSHLHDGAVPDSVYVVALASDVEIVTREQGLSRALEVIARKSGKAYPGSLRPSSSDRPRAGWRNSIRTRTGRRRWTSKPADVASRWRWSCWPTSSI
ncbi:hypothetical protein [Roseateles chitinivorans]|uniref:hypothetical protein n=1 Tax=Roseateles chitinivorans TaxID=2917965 RepID=UPI003D678CCF